MNPSAANKQRLDALASDDVLHLIVKLALPTIVGISVGALYQLLNALFIGRLGTQSIAAMALTFPFAIAVSCIGLCFGTGGASLISRYLGKGETARASRYALSACLGGACCALALSVFIQMTATHLFLFMGANNEILVLSKHYLRWLLTAYILVVLNMVAGFVVRAEGDTRFSMRTQLVAFGCNALFDPIFIFYFNLGIEGAGIATLLGQCVAVSMYLIHFLSGKSNVRWHYGFAAQRDSGAIIRIGFPGALNALLQVIALSCLNHVALRYGEATMAGIGISSRLLMVASLPLNGLCMGSQALVGYNIGAGQSGRVRHVIRTLSLFACGVALLYSVFCLIFARPMASLFSASEPVIDIASSAIVCFNLAMPFIALQQIFLMYFQSLGVAKIALYVSLLRYLVLTVPLLLILPHFWAEGGLCWSFPLADIITGGLCLFILYRQILSLQEDHDKAS